MSNTSTSVDGDIHLRRLNVEEEKKLVAEKFKEGAVDDGADADFTDGRILKEYGEPIKYDPSFKGPINNRSCTDIICCIIFIIFLMGMAVVSIVGYARGDPIRLIYPTDSHGNICGYGKYSDKPYLFFFDLVTCAKLGPAVVTGCPTPQVCVKECPSSNFVYVHSVQNVNRSELICKIDIDPTKAPYKDVPVDKLVKDQLCAAYYLESKPIIGRCMPSIFAKALNKVDALKDNIGNDIKRANGELVTGGLIQNGTINIAQFYKLKGTMELLFKDVVNSAHLIVFCLLLAMVLAMVWIVLLRWITTVMVWLTIFLFIGLFGFGTYYSYSKYYELKSMNVTSEYGLPEEFKFDFQYFLSQSRTWLAFGCTGATILAIFLLITIFLCSRIMLATKLISEASVAISHMWCVLLWPLVPFVLQILVLAYWISSMVYISSMGEPEYYNATNDVNALLARLPCDPSENATLGDFCSFVRYGGDSYKTAMLIFMVFMFFWLMNFIVALEQMTLAGAFASYYWAWDKNKDIPTFPLWSSFYRSLRYHMGSLAFGSLIIAIIQMIRAFLEYVNRKLKGSENKVAKFILTCLRCCFWCLEKFLRYINKNAYILIAIHGRNFCTAAKDGFLLIMRNVLRAAVLDKVCDFLMLISKLMVTGAIAVIAFFWFQKKVPFFEKVVPEMNYFLFAVVLVVIGTYLIADSFFDVYSIAVDTIFLCFLEDSERNDGSAERPYYMSKTKNLKMMINKK
ncbi:choline transporter-like protein 2 isoform X2 [Biomphalaria glabrata]|uniref:Choline transporter-like protein n=1 Tax=Biomphalaria glabrata TaxID=6526 RepID=A0A9W3BFC4_BIOGL|nr:choline transporter-like protein 2 isoform X2 [Biomphalaria glabrata]